MNHRIILRFADGHREEHEMSDLPDRMAWSHRDPPPLESTMTEDNHEMTRDGPVTLKDGVPLVFFATNYFRLAGTDKELRAVYIEVPDA